MIIQGRNEHQVYNAVMFATQVMVRGDHQYKMFKVFVQENSQNTLMEKCCLPYSDKINRVAMQCNLLI